MVKCTLENSVGTKVFVCFTFLLAYLLCFSVQTARADTLPKARIVLESKLEGVEYYTNGLQCFTDEQGGIDVAAGHVLFEIKKNRVVVYSAFFPLEPNQVKTIFTNCTEGCALLHVITDPPGATLSMDGAILGLTPYMNRFLHPGSYSIMATISGYVPVIRRVNLTMESGVESYTMEVSQAVKDSLEAARKFIRQQRQAKIARGFAVIGIGVAVAGAYYDWKAYTYLKEAEKAIVAYDEATTFSECEKQKGVYYAQRENMQKPLTFRNICYATAAAAFAGVYISLIF